MSQPVNFLFLLADTEAYLLYVCSGQDLVNEVVYRSHRPDGRAKEEC